MKQEEIYVNNSPGELFNLGTPILHSYNGIVRQDEIERIDESNYSEPYRLVEYGWVHKSVIIPDFVKLLTVAESVIFYSEIFGKMIITSQESDEYPIIAKLEDGDVFELTRDFKYFKDSKSSIT